MIKLFLRLFENSSSTITSRNQYQIKWSVFIMSESHIEKDKQIKSVYQISFDIPYLSKVIKFGRNIIMG